MLIDTYKKIKVSPKKQFPMPLSLRYIKELAAAGIDWRGLHLYDVTSIIYALRIDAANQYLEIERQKNLQSRGIKEVRTATAQDFDWL